MTSDGDARRALVERMEEQGMIQDPRVARALRAVPRHLFVPESFRRFAYDDRPVPIGEEQTVSAPSMVAYMLEALDLSPGVSVLDVGAGSGYAAACAAQIVGPSVVAVEIRPALARVALANLEKAGYADRVQVLVANARRDLPLRRDFDRVSVAAATRRVPQALLSVLGRGGRIVVPVGDPEEATLYRGTKRDDGPLDWEPLMRVAFVPLVG